MTARQAGRTTARLVGTAALALGQGLRRIGWWLERFDPPEPRPVHRERVDYEIELRARGHDHTALARKVTGLKIRGFTYAGDWPSRFYNVPYVGPPVPPNEDGSINVAAILAPTPIMVFRLERAEFDEQTGEVVRVVMRATDNYPPSPAEDLVAHRTGHAGAGI
jgi:hypothetical protein